MCYTKTISLLLLILFWGCKDEFLFENSYNNPLIVVDGSITNEEGPYTIKVSQTTSINEKEEMPYEGCTVTIFENSGQYETLTESEPGVYITTKGGIQGIPGNEYRISILTPDGKKYESEYQIMKEPLQIESFDAELVNLEHENYPFGLPGYQFYVNTEIAQDQDNFFLWKLIETYEYTNDYEVSKFFLGYDYRLDYGVPVLHEIENDTLMEYLHNKIYRCWKTQDVNYTYTGKTGNLSIPKITNQPLNFVSTESKRISIKYSLLIKQYIINEDAYYYWDAIEKQTSDENFLVASQPYSIIGNIKNLDDPTDFVFGFFTVASISQKRIFVDKPNKPFYYDKCNVIIDPVAISDMLEHQDPPFYYVEAVDGTGLIDEDCVDCRTKGGKNIKPDFWIE